MYGTHYQAAQFKIDKCQMTIKFVSGEEKKIVSKNKPLWSDKYEIINRKVIGSIYINSELLTNCF